MGLLFEYCRALTAAEIDSGTQWLLAAASFRGTKAEGAAPVILRSGASICRIAAKGADDLGNQCGELLATLVARSPNEGSPLWAGRHGVFWRSFSAREIHRFSAETGDRNPLHLSERRPVVQGLLLLDALHEYIGMDCGKIKMRFHSPVYADDRIYIGKEQGRWTGCCHERMCFTVEAAAISPA